MVRGGKRPGAGRKQNSGLYGEATVAMRVPTSLHATLQDILKEYKKQTVPMNAMATEIYKPSFSKLEIPLFNSRVQAGFPSPADDVMERRLDLNEHLILHPNATFFVRATGDSMIGAGIHSGDILIIDRAIAPRHNQIVLAVWNGELTVKRLYRRDGKIQLISENPHYPPFVIPSESDLQIWGVVTSVIHQFGGKS